MKILTQVIFKDKESVVAYANGDESLITYVKEVVK